MTALSPRQRDAYEYIRGHVKKHGCSPTVREIALALKLRSTNRVAELLAALEEKGAITRGRGDVRAIRVTGECPCCGHPEQPSSGTSVP